MWSISASVSRIPATGAARTSSARSPRSPSSCWRRSGEALARNHGPSAPRIASDDCVRGRAPVPARAASHVGQRQFHCGKPPPAAEPRIRARTFDLSRAMIEVRSMNVEVTAAEPAEVEADVLALAAGGLLVRELDPLFEGRLVRAAADADPMTVVQVGRELRAQRVALVALDELDPEELRTAAARAVRAHHGGGTVAWALDESLPVRPVPPGAGGRRGRGPRRLPRGCAGRATAPRAGRGAASSSAAQATSCARIAARAELVARWTNVARELVDGPPNVVTPASLAERAAALPGVRVDVLDPAAAGLPGARRRGRVERGGAAAHRPAPRAAGRARAATARARRQGRHLRRGRLLPQAAVGHRAPEGRHGRRRGGARRARRDRRAASCRSRSSGSSRPART